MAFVYDSDESLARDYRKLTPEYKGKAGQYLKDLLKLQRAEMGLHTKIYNFEKSTHGKVPEPPIRCDFCGKAQSDVEKIVAGPHMIYICDECIRLCGEIIDEVIEEENDDAEKEKGQ